MPAGSYEHISGDQVPNTLFTPGTADERLGGHIRIVGPNFEPRYVTSSIVDGQAEATECHPSGTSTGSIANTGGLAFADGADVFYDSATDQAVAAGPASATVARIGPAVGDHAATAARIRCRFTG